MSEMRSLLADTATRAMAAAGDVFSDTLWQSLEEAGLTTASRTLVAASPGPYFGASIPRGDTP